MGRLRSLGAQTPSIMISLLALVLSASGGAYAATHLPASHARASAAGVTWHVLGLRNGWVSADTAFNSGKPRVTIQNGIEYMAGSMEQHPQGSSTFGTLPVAYRPAHALYIPITVDEGVDGPGTLFISPTGKMEIYAPHFGPDAALLSVLDGVAFPVGS